MTRSAPPWGRRRSLGVAVATVLLLTPAPASLPAQGVPIHDLVIADQNVPVRLVGYGLVTGLSGTGDQTSTGRTSGHTVQSVANLLKRFDITVPPELLRTRNVAAVLVTAEVSPYLRAGGRFEVQVSSVGDARSLRGGVLWMTPLIAEAGGQAIATAQGNVVVDDQPMSTRRRYAYIEGSARIASGGVVETDLPRPKQGTSTRLLLREPDIGTASRIAAVIDSVVGKDAAKVEDPGSVALTLKDGEAAAQLATINGLRVEPTRTGRIVIDTRQGTVVAGGDLTLGPGVVSVGGITLTIGRVNPADSTRKAEPGALRLQTGATVQDLAAALQSVRTPAAQVAQIFEALRQAGAISAEVVAR
ncbi:MAG: flagellar basal body P-ring protein FlgI [Gemmatimonadaceae bacterium]